MSLDFGWILGGGICVLMADFVSRGLWGMSCEVAGCGLEMGDVCACVCVYECVCNGQCVAM